MINKIGVENFRVFKEYTEFEIRPITLLTGPNNAGKSSFTKLLLLLKNGIQKLNFQEGLHNLESFDKVLNWDKKDNILKLRFENRIPILGNDFFVEYEYKEAIIEKITISNGETMLLEFSNQKPTIISQDDTRYISNYNQKLNFNINLFIDLLYSLNINGAYYDYINFAGNGNIIKQRFSNFNLSKDRELLEVDFNNLIVKSEEPINQVITEVKTDRIRDYAILNEINKLEKNYILYDVFVNGKSVTKLYENDILEIQEKEFSNINFHYSNGLNTDLNKFIDLLKDSIPLINSIIKIKIQEFFKNKLIDDTVEVIESSLGKLVFVEKLYDNKNDNDNNKIDYTTTLFDQLNKFSKDVEFEHKELEYISANRGSQKRVLANKSENDIDEIVVDFFNKKYKNIDFFKEILGILEIPGELVVERFENVISVVYLKTNERKIALSDLGYGYSQIIPIILKLITMISFHPDISFPSTGTIIIEEPEANLHPNLQSKLADVFVTTLKHYPDFKFIIETHSEYFIRKLQYLTAKNEISPENSVIYFFNSDKYVTSLEPKVKKIEILENGNLSDTFGPGFYDEALKLQFDLMKFHKEKNS